MGSSFTTEYRFGWRWLLPKESACYLGTDKTAEAFFRAPASQVDDESIGPVQLTVIDADSVTRTAMGLQEAQFANCLYFAVYGSDAAVEEVARRLSLHRFNVRNYGLIPPHTPRVAVPLSSTRAALLGLNLHTPGRGVAKLAVRLLRVLLKFGYAAPIRRSRLLIASREPSYQPGPLAELGIDLFNGCDFALYLGGLGPERKTVALPIGEHDPQHIIKTAELPQARAKLANEARLLEYLAGTIVANQVPVLATYRCSESVSVLVQQYFRTRSCSIAKRDSAVIEFLGSTARIESTRLSLNQYLEERMPNSGLDMAFVTANLRLTLEQLIAKRASIGVPIGLSHGDFAPWNCGMVGPRLVVYDWEEGRTDGIPLWDAFSYVASQQLLLYKERRPKKIVSKTITFANQIYPALGLSTDEIEVAFVLWCFSRLPSAFSDIHVAMAKLVVGGFR